MYTYGFCWTERDGSTTSIHGIEARTMAEAKEFAKKHGYPGHRGGWWEWFKDDCRAFLKRIL